MGDKKRIEEWYAKMNEQFEEDRKNHDYSDPEMDKWFYKTLDEKMGKDDKPRTEECYDKINKQFEEDSKTHDYRDPDMNRIFYDMLDEHFKKDRKRRIAKVTGIAAGIVIALSVALNGFTEVAYGESLIDIIRNSIQSGKFSRTAFSQNDDSKFEEYDDATICYEVDSIEKIFEKVVNDITAENNELFYVKDLPNKYKQWIAKYNTKFQTITIDSQCEDDYFHICEELTYENIVSGIILESEIVSTVFNENLQMNIDIVKQMDNVRNEGYYLEVFYDNKRLKIEGNGALEEFETIAKNISMVKGN